MSAEVSLGGQSHDEPVGFVAAVLARAAAEGYSLAVSRVDVPFRYVWQWQYRGVNCELQREVLSASLDEVRLRACFEFCRDRGWPIHYEPRGQFHFELERVPPTAGQLRLAGAYVPPHVPDYEVAPEVVS